MSQPFESMAEEGEVIPVCILAYNLPSGIITLWYTEGGLWEIRGNEGQTLIDYLVSWNHAIESWEKIVPVRR